MTMKTLIRDEIERLIAMTIGGAIAGFIGCMVLDFMIDLMVRKEQRWTNL